MEYLLFLDTPIMVVIILALAVWRLSFMISVEDGAFSITYGLRLFGYRVHSPVGMSRFQAWKNSLKPARAEGYVKVHLEADNHFGKLISCIMCTSIWVALFALLGMYFYDLWYVKIVYQLLALSGATIILNNKGLK